MFLSVFNTPYALTCNNKMVLFSCSNPNIELLLLIQEMKIRKKIKKKEEEIENYKIVLTVQEPQK